MPFTLPAIRSNGGEVDNTWFNAIRTALLQIGQSFPGFTASAASNALTITLTDNGGGALSASNQLSIMFRSATATTGQLIQRLVSAPLSITIPSGTTIGTANATQAYIYIYALDNAGTVELALSLFRFDEGSPQNTTAIAGGSSSTTLYSESARTGVPIRLLGRISVNEVTAGTWASAPMEISEPPFLPPYPAPTIQKFGSGSGTYTTPAGVKYLRVRIVGGGGGGASSGTAAIQAGGTGGNTTFGTLTANGGQGGQSGSGSGGTGGAASIGSGATGLALAGGGGAGYSQVNTISLSGGVGGNSVFGGGGGGAYTGLAGVAGQGNTGGGGGGGGGNAAQSGMFVGAGGGAGGYVEAYIYNPAATYAYAVGTGGTAGGAGTNGYAGGAGGSGFIMVEEFYQ